LSLNPPDHAAVFAVGEKTAIQALDRLDPVLPLSPGQGRAARLRGPRTGGRPERRWQYGGNGPAERT
jgi:hypothetical protein